MISVERSADLEVGLPAEQVLLCRLLGDAIRALEDPGLIRRDAEVWIAAVDRDWPLSFDNVCQALGIDPNPLRAALLRSGAGCTREARGRVLRLVGGAAAQGGRAAPVQHAL